MFRGEQLVSTTQLGNSGMKGAQDGLGTESGVALVAQEATKLYQDVVLVAE